MLTAIIPPWHHLYVNVGLTEPLILRAQGSRQCEAPSFYVARTCFELAVERAFRAGHLESCNLFWHADVSGVCS